MAAAIGLDIGSSAVRGVQLRQGRRDPALEHVGQVQLPVGAVRDGDIIEPDIVVAALKQLWETFKLRGRKVVIGVANQHVVVRRVDLPFMTEADLRMSLPLHADGLIPMPVEQAVLDFCLLGEREGEDGTRQVRILLAAAHRGMVDALLDVVHRAHLHPVAIELDAFAAMRSLMSPDMFAERGAEMLVDVGSTVTDLIVHVNGAPQFVRTVLFGGETITNALMSALDVEHDTAEHLKGGAALGALGLLPAEREALDVISGQAQLLVDEVRRSIDYCAAQRDIPQIGRVVLTGGTSKLPQVLKALARGLSLDVRRGSPLRVVEHPKSSELAEAEAFLAVAVGLALRTDA